MAERAVQTIKQLLKKAAKNGEDPFIAVQAHRARPDPNGGPSPAERLFGRQFDHDYHLSSSTTRRKFKTTTTY